MITEEQLIRKGTPKGRRLDLLTRALLSGITYAIVLVALMLFGKIECVNCTV